MEAKLKEICVDLGEFLGQKDQPVKAKQWDKLQQVHRDLGALVGMHVSPVMRAGAFGRGGGGGQGSRSRGSHRPTSADSKILLDVEKVGQKGRTGSVDFNNSNESVPDLEDLGFGINQPATVNQLATDKAKHAKPPHLSGSHRSSSPKPTDTTTSGHANDQHGQQQERSDPNQGNPDNRNSANGDHRNDNGNNINLSRGTGKHYADETCAIISDSQWRIIGGFLPRTDDQVKKTSTSFQVHAIGGASIARLTQDIFDKKIPIADNCRTLILHAGVKDVTDKTNRLNAVVMRKEVVRLVNVAKQTYPDVAEICLSLIFPVKTGNMALRADVQIANSIIGAAASETRVRIFDIAQFLNNGEGIRANFYENDRHLNHKGAKYLAFRVRERFGFVSNYGPGNLNPNRNGVGFHDDPHKRGGGNGNAQRGAGGGGFTQRTQEQSHRRPPNTFSQNPRSAIRNTPRYNNSRPPDRYTPNRNADPEVSPFRFWKDRIERDRVPPKVSSNAPVSIDALSDLLNKFSSNLLLLFKNTS